jgi:ribosomal protein L31
MGISIKNCRPACDLVRNSIIKRTPDIVTRKYICYLLKSATGSLYVTTNSPQFISGQCRMLGRKNGQYPFRYASLLEEVFGPSQGEAVEVCSGWVTSRPDLITVDINPARHPSYVGDGQCLPEEWENRFYRWYADPPYNARTAEQMYGTTFPSWSKLLVEGARVTRHGGLLFLLLGDVNVQWHPRELIRIGWIPLSIVPNQELRAVHIYLKKANHATENSVHKNILEYI